MPTPAAAANGIQSPGPVKGRQSAGSAQSSGTVVTVVDGVVLDVVEDVGGTVVDGDTVVVVIVGGTVVVGGTTVVVVDNSGKDVVVVDVSTQITTCEMSFPLGAVNLVPALTSFHTVITCPALSDTTS